ncbi:GGDEF domain-containing protein [Halomonas sp. V046]|uniref:GGDEF domain-containing protein n=1 Tax=Halomonas sp. V046 TaxID=3459611 RepID=UPI0040448B75
MPQSSFTAHLPSSKPALVHGRDFRKYILIHLASLLGALTHVGFILVFLRLDQSLLAVFNVVSVAIWLAAWLANRAAHYNRAIYLIAGETALHATLATLLLGAASGFHFFLVPIACLVTISPNLARWKSAILGLCLMTLFILLDEDLMGDIAGPLPTLPGPLYHVLVASALFILVGFAISVRLVFEMQESRLTHMATRDALTGLFNRRFASDYLHQLAAQRQREPAPCCIALLDIDHFKRINDSYGHDVGDLSLVSISSLLQAHFRRSDILCRWGGEEFLVIFPNTSLEDIHPVIEQLRSQLTHLCIEHDKGEFQLTLSIGVTEIAPHETVDVPINRADRLLYRAKAEGRDRIVTDASSPHESSNIEQ